MHVVAAALALFVAAEHLGFLVLESFLWTQPAGRKVFRMSAQQAEATAALAKNQGLYNGFLSAGLVWGVWLQAQGAAHATEVLTFFLTCVVVAGIVGAITVSRSILLVQGLAGAIALIAVRLAG